MLFSDVSMDHPAVQITMIVCLTLVTLYQIKKLTE